jgi:N-acetylneuraminic acid mutarotase
MGQTFTKTFITCSAAMLMCILGKSGMAQDTWTQKANGPVYQIRNSFAIDSLGYGIDSTDFFAYSPSTNTWTQKANFPGGAREQPIIFVIGTVAYVGGGQNNANTIFTDLYAYDQASNTWTTKASFPGTARYVGESFAANGKGYFCGGYDNTNAYKDVWEYDPTANTWTQKADMPNKLAGGAGFSINNKGYVVCGTPAAVDDSLKNECWQYDPSSNTWTAKANFPGAGRVDMWAGATTTHGYAGTGSPHIGNGNASYKDFYEYDPVANTWTTRASYVGAGGKHSTGFAINTKVYMGFGSDTTGSGKNDFWQYNPVATGVAEQNKNDAFKLYPNPNQGQFTLAYQLSETGKLEIIDVTGKVVSTYILPMSAQHININAANLIQGVYVYKVIANGAILHTGKLLIE